MQFLGQSLDLVPLKGYTLPPVNITGASNVFTVDLTLGNEFVVTTAAASTVNLPAPLAGQNYTVTIVYTGNYAITWTPASGMLKWVGGTEPTQTKVNGKEDIYIFSSRVNATLRGVDGGRNI